MAPEIRHFVEILPEPSFLLTNSGDIVFANSGAAQLVGRNRNELAGARLSAFLASPPDKADDFLRLCARSRQLLPGALQFRAGDGSALELRCDGAVLQPRTGDDDGLLFLRCRPKAEATDQFVLLNQKIAALSKEILERRKAEHQRDELLNSERAARIEAERASQMKDEFLATLSHELRTPLNAIMGWTTLLELEPLTETLTEGIRVIARNARVQKQLVEDLLDMSRIISGRVRLDIQPVNLAAVIESAIASVRPGAESKGVRIQTALDPIAGPVKGDPNRLQQVIWNLLSNALKFTPAGGRIQVLLERVNSHLEITVSDTGKGISPEFLRHIFDRFRQQDASTTRRHGGLGIGLSIAKQLVELHGGSIRAKSPGEGKGATFIISLPLPPFHDPAAPSSERVHPAAADERWTGGLEAVVDLSGIAILVVDDEPDARTLVQKLLDRCGATVHLADSVEAALRLLDVEPVNVLVSDIGMPDVDGFEFMRRIRRRTPERGGAVPAIALTAFARSEDRMRAMMVGYNLHLSKPVEPKELVVAVAALAGRASEPRE